MPQWQVTKHHCPTDTAVDGEAGLRPSQYAFLDRLMTEAGGIYVYSLQKAKQYKDEAKQGSLQIHTLADARANPPREFKPLPPLPSTVSITAGKLKYTFIKYEVIL